MSSSPEFTLDAVTEALAELGIAFECSGNSVANRYAFKSLREPEPGGIYYVTGTRVISAADISPSLVICEEKMAIGSDNAGLHVRDPQLVFYKLMQQLVPVPRRPAGIHPTAIVDTSSRIAPSASIGPYCVVENATIGAGVQLHSHVVVMPGTTIEDNVTVEPHTALGATGVAWVWDPKTNTRVIQPQTGEVKIGAGCFLGSNITVVRGSVNEITCIGTGTVIAHGSKIGHGCVLNAECHLANNVSLAGNVTLGARSFIGSGAVIRPHVQLAEGTVVGAGAVVVKSVKTPRTILFGNPAAVHQPSDRPLSGVPKSLAPQHKPK